VKISVSITNYSWPTGASELGPRLRDVAQAADAHGLDTVWVADHLLQADPASTPDEPMLEAYTTLGYLAAHTSRVRLGAMVSAVTFRAPALLVKAVTTLDALSGGRAWLGIGAGYQQDEAAALGLDLPPVTERFERLEETLRLARQMWSGDESAFHGTHHLLEHPVSHPRPVTQPHPPVMIGGTGERHTLRLVAAYGDACNLFDIPDGGQTVTRKLDVLRRHCQAAGRPFDEIETTISTGLAPSESADAFAERCSRLAELGIDHVVVITRGQPWTEDAIATVAAATSVPATAGTR
jgi:F420-dependent oxidoreductase-like protein